ncbi:MAG: hypothetical protein JWO70_4565, partial [Betaproteobacteria bacterium]|nr:hypothetical protein [Betaproteobacteria bacterium]
MKLKVFNGAVIALALAASTGALAAELAIPDSAKQQFATMSANAQVKKALEFI